MRLIALLLTMALAAAMVGCGGDDEDSDGGSADKKADTETAAKKTDTGTAAPPDDSSDGTTVIEESEFKLTPSDVKVDKAGSHTFRPKNGGGTIHALKIEGNGLVTETTGISPGKGETLTVKLSPGKYKIYCPIVDHEPKGMVGTVTVGGGGGGSGGASGPSTSEDSDSGGAAAPGY